MRAAAVGSSMFDWQLHPHGNDGNDDDIFGPGTGTVALEAGLAHAIDEQPHSLQLLVGFGAAKVFGSTGSSSSSGRGAFSQTAPPQTNAAAASGAASGSLYTTALPTTTNDDLSMLIASIDDELKTITTRPLTTSTKQELHGQRASHRAGTAAAAVGMETHELAAAGACNDCGAAGGEFVCLCHCGNGNFWGVGVASTHEECVDALPAAAAAPPRSPSPFPFPSLSPALPPSPGLQSFAVPDLMPAVEMAFSRAEWTVEGSPPPGVVPGSPADSAYSSNAGDGIDVGAELDYSFWTGGEEEPQQQQNCMDVALPFEALDVFAM